MEREWSERRTINGIVTKDRRQYTYAKHVPERRKKGRRRDDQ